MATAPGHQLPEGDQAVTWGQLSQLGPTPELLGSLAHPSLPVHYQFITSSLPVHYPPDHYRSFAMGICKVQRSSFNQCLALQGPVVTHLSTSFNLKSAQNGKRLAKVCKSHDFHFVLSCPLAKTALKTAKIDVEVPSVPSSKQYQYMKMPTVARPTSTWREWSLKIVTERKLDIEARQITSTTRHIKPNNHVAEKYLQTEIPKESIKIIKCNLILGTSEPLMSPKRCRMTLQM